MSADEHSFVPTTSDTRSVKIQIQRDVLSDSLGKFIPVWNDKITKLYKEQIDNAANERARGAAESESQVLLSELTQFRRMREALPSLQPECKVEAYLIPVMLGPLSNHYTWASHEEERSTLWYPTPTTDIGLEINLAMLLDESIKVNAELIKDPSVHQLTSEVAQSLHQVVRGDQLPLSTDSLTSRSSQEVEDAVHAAEKLKEVYTVLFTSLLSAAIRATAREEPSGASASEEGGGAISPSLYRHRPHRRFSSFDQSARTLDDVAEGRSSEERP